MPRGTALAQRELHWQRVEVDATLDARGALHIVETQTMVFTGDWNGGERRFDIRPWQTFSFDTIQRMAGGTWRPLTPDSSLDDVDDYGWEDAATLRWRVRRPTDPPFQNSTFTYQLRYSLGDILLQTDAGYTLDHDFLFPERDGTIQDFVLRLALAPEWTAATPVPREYTARAVGSGRGFVVTLPLRYSGVEPPAARDVRRPREIVWATGALLGLGALLVAWFFGREQWYGRFAPVEAQVDRAWLEAQIFKYPAEVVGAAWDESIGAAEIVALIARMTAEGKLTSTLKGSSMSLRLNVDRDALEGHERTLVDGLFFNNKTHTNKELIQQHYRASGYDPASAIGPELKARVDAALPPGRAPARMGRLLNLVWLGGLALLVREQFVDAVEAAPAFTAAGVLMVLLLIGAGVGSAFRSSIHWGRGAALACLIPAFLAVAAAAVFLWSYLGPRVVEASDNFAYGVAALALGVLVASTEAMKSRQPRAAIAFRKRLAAARAYFKRELQQPSPALRDEWTPWVLAFGLGGDIDRWSARQEALATSSHGGSSWSSSSSSSSESSAPAWTGFTGGRSGGAGASGSWAAAAGGLAAGVSPPSSSGSGGSSGGGSSGGGSSGGGGGGGW